MEREECLIRALMRTFRAIASKYDKVGIDDLDDVVQNSVLRFLSSRFKQHPSYSWCHKVVRSVIVDSIRRNKKHSFDVPLSVNEEREIGCVCESSPELGEISHVLDDRTLVEPDLLPAIMAMFQNLGALERRALALHAVGYEYHEIAEQMKIPKTAVRFRIYQGRKAARLILADHR